MEDEINAFDEYTTNLWNIHEAGLVHCDLHGEKIVLNDNNKKSETEKDFHPSQPFICDLGLSQSVNSHNNKSNSTIQGILPFIAPEVFHTYKFTQKSDIYSFGMVNHLLEIENLIGA